MKLAWKRQPRRVGREAREDAERGLEQTEARWPEVREMAESMRELRKRNHFAENIAYSMGRRP